MLKENPVKSNNREELVHYVCGLHNIVNHRLGKPQFECQKAFDFWGGGCGCDGGSGEKDASHDFKNKDDAEEKEAQAHATAAAIPLEKKAKPADRVEGTCINAAHDSSPIDMGNKPEAVAIQNDNLIVVTQTQKNNKNKII
jgi:hypothetical protein